MNGYRILSVLLVLLLAGCSSGQAKPSLKPTPDSQATVQPTVMPTHAAVTPNTQTSAPKTPSPTATPMTTEQQILALSSEAVAALKDQSFDKLQSMIDPEQGVRFSPYTHVDVKKDVVLKPAQLAKAMEDKTVYTWGSYDGSGEPIKLTFAEYYRKFIFDHDFAKAEQTSYDKPIGKGNTANNISEAYPGSHVVEYHFSGFDKKLEGHDWVSLKLVFAEIGGKWRLAGIVHDQWTI